MNADFSHSYFVFIPLKSFSFFLRRDLQSLQNLEHHINNLLLLSVLNNWIVLLWSFSLLHLFFEITHLLLTSSFCSFFRLFFKTLSVLSKYHRNIFFRIIFVIFSQRNLSSYLPFRSIIFHQIFESSFFVFKGILKFPLIVNYFIS